ncbi:MAG: hypothetical protein AB1724_19885 [Thermodesulfobacteriota bacterium]
MYFSLAQRKVPKETFSGSLATPRAWLPSREYFFRRGQELAWELPLKLFFRNFTVPVFDVLHWETGAQTACPLFPKKTSALGCAATGRGVGNLFPIVIPDTDPLFVRHAGEGRYEVDIIYFYGSRFTFRSDPLAGMTIAQGLHPSSRYNPLVFNGKSGKIQKGGQKRESQ